MGSRAFGRRASLASVAQGLQAVNGCAVLHVKPNSSVILQYKFKTLEKDILNVHAVSFN